MTLESITRALTENRAATDPAHEDPTLRGRTYGIPFDAVWKAAIDIAKRRRGWTITYQDDLKGVIEIEAATPVFKFVDDMEVRIFLDQNAQTRVDARSRSRKGKADFGTNARRLRRFFKHLDREVAGSHPRQPSHR